jgi:hypothetical protein
MNGVTGIGSFSFNSFFEGFFKCCQFGCEYGTIIEDSNDYVFVGVRI